MKNVLVTGGGGFVGTAIVKLLLEKGCSVSVAGRNLYSHITDFGVKCFVGDISDKAFTDRICRGIDTVFHTAAKAGIWGEWSEYKKTNVYGTENVIESCLKNDVEKLIYTSTPSVVFNRNDVVEGNESLPYATEFLCNYAKSKVLAEKLVLRCNPRQLKTCAIRPHLIWGPGDPHLIPRLIERGKQKSLKIIGNGDNLVDITFIENVANAHILAALSMDRTENTCGNAYFIGQEKPVNLWNWINQLFVELKIPPVTQKVPFKIGYFAGSLLERMHTMVRSGKEPKMTRFLAYQLSHSHFFSHANAKKDFGYEPVVSLIEGQERLIRWIKEQ